MKKWTEKALRLLGETLNPPKHELNELDWKAALSPDKKRVAEHLSAFSNYPSGGFLIYGVDADGTPVGMGEKSIQTTLTHISNIGRSGLEPAISLDHCVESYNGVKLLFIFIKESNTKPVHVRGNITDTFIRSLATTRKATQIELASLMLNSKPIKWESLRASPFMTDEELPTHLDISAIFQILGRVDFTSPQEVLSWLETEKFIEREPAGGGYLTNLGVVAAAKKISDFDDLGRKAVRLIIYKGFNKSKIEREIIGQKGYAVGFQGLIEYLTDRLPKSEVIEKALRKEAPIYPIVTLREIIANALIHQDFTITGSGPLIEVFDNRIEVSNPGNLLPGKKTDRLLGAQPESRNQELGRAFTRYKICEELGSGLIRAVEQAEHYGLPPVEFFEDTNSFKVTIHSPRAFSQMSVQERLQACYQHATLKHCSKDVMTNKSLRERLKMPEKQRPMVSNLIQEALMMGLIKKADPESESKKYTEYLPYWA
jgi:ATP-dependent DNA helicase RecG